MGVSWVFVVDEQQRLVEAALERVGAEQRATYKVDCTVFKPTSSVAAQLGQFFLLHHSNYPDTSCNFVEVTNSTGPEPNYARATSDQGFDSIMQNFATAFASDARFEVNGSEYHLKDFRIRVGTTLMNTSAKAIVMSLQPSPSSPVLLGNIDAVLAAVLGNIEDLDIRNDAIQTNNANDGSSQSLAELFVNHDVNERKDRKYAKELETKEERQRERQRKLDERRSEEMAAAEQIHEEYFGIYSMRIIKDTLKRHKYDVVAACAELSNGTNVIDEEKRRSSKQEPVITSYATWPSLTEQANKTQAKASSPSIRRVNQMKKEVREDILELELEAEKKNEQADHHILMANEQKNTLAFGALNRIARDERRDAERLYREANLLIANELKTSLDLHNFTIDRALHLIRAAIIELKRRRTHQRRLELIPGHGTNNPQNKAVLKQAIIQWLNQEKIKFHCPTNPGLIIIELFSVPYKFGC
ncbi:Mediator of RNA polymerase II transcription subunit 20 [Aphelenchoides besseyi]|nr:Mediator of RNA polymerase II transcription subunit 20 [Aphelenchoides besseyi]